MGSVWRIRLLTGLLALALLTGCARGPDGEVLEGELQARLDSSFREDLFRLQTFRRTGSAPFHDVETGDSGVYVYYDAVLEFLQDYSLTQWRGLNIGTLAFAVGAQEAGISGFHPRANQQGDRLTVHGRLAFSEDETGAWVPRRDAVERPLTDDPAVSRDLPVRGVDAVLLDTRALLAKELCEPEEGRKATILRELRSAVKRIDLARAREQGMLTLGSGPAAGTYREFGRALAAFAEQRNLPLFSAESVGSVENASRLQAGELDFGLVQSDVLQLFYEGREDQYFIPSRNLRSVASLWPEAVHLVALEGSGIRTPADLKRRRVAIGKRGSGSRVNAVMLGVASRLEVEELPVVREIDLEDAISQLEAGEIDALFVTAAVPSPALQGLAARRGDVRFLSVPMSLVNGRDQRFYSYYPMTVEERTYPGQDAAFTTLGLTAALATSVNVADERIEQLLDLLLAGGEELAQRYYRAAFISRETMRLGLAVPLHPAAERYYRRFDAQGSEQGDAAEGQQP